MNWMNWRSLVRTGSIFASSLGFAALHLYYIWLCEIILRWVMLRMLKCVGKWCYVVCELCLNCITLDYIRLYWVDLCWVCWNVLCTCKFTHCYLSLCESIANCVGGCITLDYITSWSKGIVVVDVGAQAGASLCRQNWRSLPTEWASSETCV